MDKCHGNSPPPYFPSSIRHLKRDVGPNKGCTKGQLISKCLFGNFLQKTNENKSHISKIEFVCSFFGGNVGLKKSFKFYLDL